jgi:hypothetical protein
VIDLTTVRDIDDREHRILEFTIELCGDVISAIGPTGWRVERTPVTRRCDQYSGGQHRLSTAICRAYLEGIPRGFGSGQEADGDSKTGTSRLCERRRGWFGVSA